MLLHNREELQALRKKAEEALHAQKIRILICAGTGCIASGSKEIYEKMKNCILEEEEETQIFFADYSFFEAVTELTIVANRIVRKHFLPGYFTNEWNYLKEGSKYTFSKGLFGKISDMFLMDEREVENLYYT